MTDHEPRTFETDDEDVWRAECSCGLILGEVDDPGDLHLLHDAHLRAVEAGGDVMAGRDQLW